jgi:hypothetical protein
MTRPRALFLAATLASVAVVTPARADDALAAEAAFAEARSLMAQGRYAEACPRLQASYDLDPALGTLMNHAECLRQVGKTASAWLRYRTAAAEALRQGQKEREAIARDRAKALEGRLCRVTLRQGASSVLRGTMASRDGATPEPLLLDVAVPVDPGEHTFVFAAPGRAPKTVRLAVQAPLGDAPCAETPVVVPDAGEPLHEVAPPPSPVLPREDAAPLPPVPLREAIAPVVAPAPGWNTWHTLAVVAGSAGVVALGVGSGFGLDAISKNATGNGQCTSHGCSGSGETLLHDAGRSADAATVLFTVGAAALVTGVALWIASPSLHRSPTTALLTF